MTTILIFFISLIVMLTFLMLMQNHLSHMINLLIMQNVIVTAYIFTKALLFPDVELYISLIATGLIKVIVLPLMLWKLMRFLKVSEHVDLVSKKPTLQLMGIALMIFVLILSHRLTFLVGRQTIIGFSLLLANSMLALLLIIFRRKTISQVVGLLAMENSIFLLTLTLTDGFPWVVELGISFDVLIGLMIFGLFLLRIHHTHGSLHVHYLEKLKERI